MHNHTGVSGIGTVKSTLPHKCVSQEHQLINEFLFIIGIRNYGTMQLIQTASLPSDHFYSQL